MPDRYQITVVRIVEENAPAVTLYAQTTDDPTVLRRVVAAVNVRVRTRRRSGKGAEDA